MEQKFYPLIFGGDINVYSVARAFHEEYGIKSTCYGKYPSGPAARSSIIDYHAHPDNETPEAFLRYVNEFASTHTDAPILVIGAGDAYVQLISENKDKLPENCIAPYIDAEMLNNLVQKEYFYNLCDKYDIDHPGTFIYKKEMGHDFEIPFEAPFICKPSCSISYWEHPFEGNNKVFIVNSREELLDILDRCYAAGYPDSMIIQDMIPGDDTYMRVLTCYSDQHGKVKMMCLGHTLLEEHTPHGSGNHATIITEYNEEICTKIKAFLEDIGYVGYSNFDIKYDERDGKYKFFEINCRQGRSNYYVTGAGYNIARYFVEDYIFNKDIKFEICKTESLWSVVPIKVAKDYIVSKYHPTIDRLLREKKFSNSLVYSGEKNLLHKLWVRHNLARHKKNYATYYEKKN